MTIAPRRRRPGADAPVPGAIGAKPHRGPADWTRGAPAGILPDRSATPSA